MKVFRVVLIGPPGSGKSTQAEILAVKMRVPFLSTGNLLREFAQGDSQFSKDIKNYLDRGEIVPDELTIQLIKDVVSEEMYKKGFVAEGFPRTIKQAEAMDFLIDQVVCLKIADQEVMDRLLSRQVCPKCGENYNRLTQPPKVEGICDQCQTKLTNRSDDNREVILNRLKIYHETTEPVIAYFQSKNKLIMIDGGLPVEIISEKIYHHINMVTA